MSRTDVGRIVLAATPIGDPSDASARLVSLLASADVIAAEDTRRLQRLASDLGVSVSGRVVSFFEGNESSRVDELIAAAQNGKLVLVVTDAGMPSVSDPGFRIVDAAVANDVPVTVAPGPSATLTALALSGLAVDRFCFEGFLPRKAGERASRLAALREETRTMIFFEAPHRIIESLAAMNEAFGPDRLASVSRELTKTYEETRRGTLAELTEWATGDVRGELTIVVAGANSVELAAARGLSDSASWVLRVAELVTSGVDSKDAIAQVAKEAGVPKREVYDAVVAAKGNGSGADAPQ